MPASYQIVGAKDKWLKPLFAEFLGTLLFVLIGTMQAVNYSVISSAISQGFSLTCLIASLGTLSGGHFNPAITLATTLAGGVDIVRAIAYVCVQFLASILGAAINLGSVGRNIYDSNTGGITLGAVNNINGGQIFLAEFFLIFLFILTYLMTAVNVENNPLAPLYIGCSLIASIFAGGKISGASFNPARTFGPWVVNSIVTGKWKYTQWPFYVAPFLGAATVALIYKYFLLL